MRRESGFTLLELLIALLIFSLLATGSWRLFDGLVRVERHSTLHAQQLRGLQRAMAVIERDLLHVLPARGIHLSAGLLNLQRLNWRNPLDQPRSEWQEVSYRLEQGQLWRYSRGDAGPQQRQLLLDQVSRLQWQVLDAAGHWQRAVGAMQGARGVALSLDQGRFEGVERVFMLAEVAP